MTQWISTKFAIPTIDEKFGLSCDVMTINKYNSIVIYRLKICKNRKMYWQSTHGYLPSSFDEITHWQPLPEPPKDDV